MADRYVSTVTEFLNLSATASTDDKIYVTANLDFGGRTFSDSLVDLPKCSIDFMGHSMLNVLIRTTSIINLYVIKGTKGGTFNNVSIKNLDQLDVEIFATNASVSLMPSGDHDNIRVSARVECNGFTTFSSGGSISNVACLLNVYAKYDAYGISSSNLIRNCRVGGKIYSERGNVTGIGRANNISKCYVNAVLVSATASAYGISETFSASTVTDCLVEGVVRAKSNFAVGINGRGDTRRCICRAVVDGRIAYGISGTSDSTYIITANLFEGSITYSSSYAVISTLDNSNYRFNNFRKNTVTENGSLVTAENNSAGYLVTDSQTENLSFYRDVLGFDIM